MITRGVYVLSSLVAVLLTIIAELSLFNSFTVSNGMIVTNPRNMIQDAINIPNHQNQLLTFRNCFNSETGDLDLLSFTKFRIQEREGSSRKRIFSNTDRIPPEDKDSGRHHLTPKKQRAGGKEEEEENDVTKSTWYQQYVISDRCLTSFKRAKKFRSRFRMPIVSFRELVNDARANNWFPHNEVVNCAGKIGHPIDLLMLGSLRYLGRGWTFDDLEESTNISAETHRRFFHRFIEACSQHLFPKWVKLPETEEEIRECMSEYTEAGFDGCIGSTDATHVVMEKCSVSLKNAHLGGKSSLTTRAFQITVNHKRQIISSTKGFPGRWNDKTIVRFDELAMCITKGTALQNVEFYLSDMNGNRSKYNGVWLLVDNGYLEWPTTIPPFKVTTIQSEHRWSRWAESMRKDVECTYGILKGRWRILKTGIRVYSLESVDNIWLTCCALHNMLLHVDGLHQNWNKGVASPYSGEMGWHEVGDTERYVPEIFRRVRNGIPGHLRTLDMTEMCSNPNPNPNRIPIPNPNTNTDDTSRQVKSLSFNSMRTKLVINFHYRWAQKDIKWPSRTGLME